jgi:hypothetical protein
MDSLLEGIVCAWHSGIIELGLRSPSPSPSPRPLETVRSTLLVLGWLLLVALDLVLDVNLGLKLVLGRVLVLVLLGASHLLVIHRSTSKCAEMGPHDSLEVTRAQAQGDLDSQVSVKVEGCLRSPRVGSLASADIYA